MSITPIGFNLWLLLRLNQHSMATAEAEQHFERPIIEAADFNDGGIAVAACLVAKFLKELGAVFRFPRNLPFEDHISVLVSQGNGKLFCVLIGSEVQHGMRFSKQDLLAILDSMTLAERASSKLIWASRIERIAIGSGVKKSMVRGMVRGMSRLPFGE